MSPPEGFTPDEAPAGPTFSHHRPALLRGAAPGQAVHRRRPQARHREGGPVPRRAARVPRRPRVLRHDVRPGARTATAASSGPPRGAGSPTTASRSSASPTRSSRTWTTPAPARACCPRRPSRRGAWPRSTTRSCVPSSCRCSRSRPPGGSCSTSTASSTSRTGASASPRPPRGSSCGCPTSSTDVELLVPGDRRRREPLQARPRRPRGADAARLRPLPPAHPGPAQSLARRHPGPRPVHPQHQPGDLRRPPGVPPRDPRPDAGPVGRARRAGGCRPGPGRPAGARGAGAVDGRGQRRRAGHRRARPARPAPRSRTRWTRSTAPAGAVRSRLARAAWIYAMRVGPEAVDVAALAARLAEVARRHRGEGEVQGYGLAALVRLKLGHAAQRKAEEARQAAEGEEIFAFMSASRRAANDEQPQPEPEAAAQPEPPPEPDAATPPKPEPEALPDFPPTDPDRDASLAALHAEIAAVIAGAAARNELRRELAARREEAREVVKKAFYAEVGKVPPENGPKRKSDEDELEDDARRRADQGRAAPAQAPQGAGQPRRHEGVPRRARARRHADPRPGRVHRRAGHGQVAGRRASPRRAQERQRARLRPHGREGRGVPGRDRAVPPDPHVHLRLVRPDAGGTREQAAARAADRRGRLPRFQPHAAPSGCARAPRG